MTQCWARRPLSLKTLPSRSLLITSKQLTQPHRVARSSGRHPPCWLLFCVSSLPLIRVGACLVACCAQFLWKGRTLVCPPPSPRSVSWSSAGSGRQAVGARRAGSTSGWGYMTPSLRAQHPGDRSRWQLRPTMQEDPQGSRAELKGDSLFLVVVSSLFILLKCWLIYLREYGA